MKDDIDKAVKRTQQYWFIDGLTEIAVGVVFVLVGLLFLVESFAPPDSPLAHISALGLPLIVIIGWSVTSRLVSAAKARLTYPRTGYVKYRRPPTRQRVNRFVVGAAVGAGVGFVVATLALTAPASLAWIPALQGLIVGAFWAYFGWHFALTRFYVLAIVSVALGPATALAGLGDIRGNGVYFSLMGMAMIVSGGLALISYLRQTKAPGDDAQ
ncbi:MAG: hypothetical protein ACUVX1_09505 [Chloroflexota bacterium]